MIVPRLPATQTSLGTGVVLLVSLGLLQAAPIHDAARSGNTNELAALLARNPDHANLPAELPPAQTPLFDAVIGAQPASVQLLLASGANVNARQDFGLTPLLEACRQPAPSETIVRLLLDAKADPRARDRSGQTTLHYLAATQPVPPLLSLLVERGADINAHDFAGRTPVESLRDKPEALARWVALGAKPELANEDQWLDTLTAQSPVPVQARLVGILTNETGRALLLRQKAAIALGTVGRPTSPTLQAVRQQLAREPEPMCLSLLWLLTSYGPEAASALPEVQNLRPSSSANVRFLTRLTENQLLGLVPAAASADDATVTGRTLHVARSWPGDFTGRPGTFLTPTPAPATTLYFLGPAGLFQTASDADGNYQLRLPAGSYAIATLHRPPTLAQPEVLLLVAVNSFGEAQRIDLQKGVTLNYDADATIVYPTPSPTTSP